MNLSKHHPLIHTARTVARVRCQCGFDTGLIQIERGDAKRITTNIYLDHIKIITKDAA